MGFEMGFFNVFSLIFPIMFIGIFGIIIFRMLKGVKEWSHNNKQSIVQVESTIVSKRISVSHHNHMNENHNHTSSSTTYYVTFQFINGERSEFVVKGKDYGIMVERDRGILSFQGSRFISFDRNSI